MIRFATCVGLALALAACQSTGFPRPEVPAGATADEENRILCRQPRSSPWWVPCNDVVRD